MRQRLIQAVLPVLLLFGMATGNATDAQWTLEKDKHGIVVSQRPVTGSPFKETNGVMMSTARLPSIVAVLRNIGDCPQWLYRCRYGEAVKQINAAEHIYYTVIDSPLMLRDRDTYVHSHIAYFPQTDKIVINMRSAPGFAQSVEKRVRMLNFTGFWELQEQPDGRVQMTYQVHCDPQVSAVGAADRMMVTSVLETLQSVDRLARSDDYRNAKFTPDEMQAISAHP